jgi:type IV secretion system protein TrbL
VARAGASAAVSPLKRAASRASDSLKSSYSDGAKAGFAASGGTSTMGTVGRDSSPAPSTPSTPDGPPAWAQQMRRGRAMSHGVTAAAHAVRSGDSHGGGSSVSLSESDRT